MEIRFENELVPLIIQDNKTGEVLSLFYANEEAVKKMNETGYVWRYSRSQKKLMKKGETSGNIMKIISTTYDCDSDAILVKVEPQGPACHTGNYTCFGNEKGGILKELTAVIQDRKLHPKSGSYTSGIISDRKKIIEKLREECEELVEANKKDEVIWEAADLLYFMLVYIENRDVKLEEVLHELKSRRK